MSVTLTPATTGPARTASPPSPACASRATRATIARPTSTSATASPAATGAPARTVTTPTSVSASRGPQVPGLAQGGLGGLGCSGADHHVPPTLQDPTVKSTWTTVPATPATRAPVWTRLTATSVHVSRATQVSGPRGQRLTGPCSPRPPHSLATGLRLCSEVKVSDGPRVLGGPGLGEPKGGVVRTTAQGCLAAGLG